MTDAERIAARKDAEETIAFIGERSPRFWEIMAAHCASRLPAIQPAAETLPMEEREAARFEKTEVKFGKYAGYEVCEIPTEYLAWLADGDGFIKDLRRYVQSSKYRQRQDQED